MKNFQVRQGDLLIMEIEELPKGLRVVSDSVILKGEATGHAHRLIGGDVFTTPEGLMFLALTQGGQVIHDEHKPIKLTKGFYSVIRQREYTNKDAVRIVVD